MRALERRRCVDTFRSMKHDHHLGPSRPATVPETVEPLRVPLRAEGDERDLRRSLRRGWRSTCPACGGGPLYDGYLHVRENCPACAEPLHHHRADDAPTWLTILVVGHVVILLMSFVWDVWNPPIWVHWTLWPPLALLMSLVLLPRFKGAVVGFQWARRMGGFAGARN